MSILKEYKAGMEINRQNRNILRETHPVYTSISWVLEIGIIFMAYLIGLLIGAM